MLAEEAAGATYNRTVAEHYDAAYATKADLGADVTFYTELAVLSGGPVLELGCGTGRVLCEIERRGIACEGLDSSEAMLAALRKRRPELSLVRSQMQKFELPGRKFALIFSAFRAFQHLYTVEDQLACLAAVRSHLVPGGVLAFDVFRPNLARMALVSEPEQPDLRYRLGADEVVRYVTIQRDLPLQLMTLDMRFERTAPDGSVRNDHERIHMRWFHAYELEHLLHRAGFTDVAIHGDFARGPVRAESADFVVFARL